MRTAVMMVGAVLTALPAAGQPTAYNGYAFSACGPTNQPAVRLVLMQGPVPSGIPETRPRPSIEFTINAPVVQTAAEFPVNAEAVKSGAGVAALSCPVVGACTTAQTGNVKISRGEGGSTLTGEFQATWPNGMPRSGRFNATWREGGKGCQ
jgi:hypothetical protein